MIPRIDMQTFAIPHTLQVLGTRLADQRRIAAAVVAAAGSFRLRSDIRARLPTTSAPRDPAHHLEVADG